MAASASLIAVVLAAPNVAHGSGEVEPAAIIRAKMQLAALAELAPAFGSPGQLEVLQAPRTLGRDQPVAATVAGDARILYRLDAAFALIPSGDPIAAARLPRSRPAASVELVALAYAEETAPPKTRQAGPGMSAIESLVEQHAEANNVPPALAQALVQVESSFNPKATGRNGEIGLLQIKPQTARAMGYKGSAKGLYDAETNLAVGMKYLAAAHDRSGGDACGTLLRYNAGLDATRSSKGSQKFCAKVKKVMAKRA